MEHSSIGRVVGPAPAGPTAAVGSKAALVAPAANDPFGWRKLDACAFSASPER